MGAEFGKCIDCPGDSGAVRLYGNKKCSFHLANPKVAVERSVAVTKEDKKKAADKELSAWFDTQKAQIPKKCENKCGRDILPMPGKLTWKTAVAHIVQKAKVQSVRVHPLNRVFLCAQCHTDFDKLTGEDFAAMPVVKVALKRLAKFFHLIRQDELKYVNKELLKKLSEVETEQI